VVAASYLVHRSTKVKADGALVGLVARDKILMAGGGNAIIEFESLNTAKSFTAHYTRRIINQAPGLEVIVGHRSYEEGQLAQALQLLQVDLAKGKTERRPSVPLLGLSVTASCRETGMPAATIDKNDHSTPLSKIVSLGREEVKDWAHKRWAEFLDKRDRSEPTFPMELDHLGRTFGDTSQIGVVHVDGNSVGRMIRDWLKKKIDVEENDAIVRNQYREWSRAIDDLGRQALGAVIRRVQESKIKRRDLKDEDVFETSGHPQKLNFELTKENDNKLSLPIRPILLGGDDLTFVCDGRIALDLATTALAVFEKAGEINLLGKVDACAGVSVVRSHAPFSRAYDLAEKLCFSAKRMLENENESGCALDWHIGSIKPSETVEDIRNRQYLQNQNELTCRPYRLRSDDNRKESWQWLAETVLDDDKSGLREGVWSDSRNKVIALGKIVREGPDGVRRAIETWQVAKPDLMLPPAISVDGFLDKMRTPLLDAVELVDLHLSLKPAKRVTHIKEGES